MRLVDDLTKAGLAYIEVGSFVSPKWVPQMAGSAEVFAGIQQRQVSPMRRWPQPARFRGRPGRRREGSGGVRGRLRSLLATQHQLLDQRQPQALRADHGSRAQPRRARARLCVVRTRLPYEGKVSAEQVAPVARALHDMGCYEVSLGDTIGTGTAGETRRLFEVVAAQVPREQLAGHFHDTYGQALANVYASLLEGISVFDSSVAGLGGCPMPKALPAISPVKTWCTCCRGWALKPASTWTC